MKKLNCVLLCSAILTSCAFLPVQASPSMQQASLSAQTEASATKAMMNQEIGDKIDINKADAQQLRSLPGVGAKKAEEIVKYRELNGNFNNINELVNVKGIGDKMLAKIIDLIKV